MGDLFRNVVLRPFQERKPPEIGAKQVKTSRPVEGVGVNLDNREIENPTTNTSSRAKQTVFGGVRALYAAVELMCNGLSGLFKRLVDTASTVASKPAAVKSSVAGGRHINTEVSEEFSAGLFKTWTNAEKLETEEVKGADGVRLPIFRRAWEAIARTNLYIEGANGELRPLVEEPVPEEDEKKLELWKEKCVNNLRAFCGYDTSKGPEDLKNLEVDKAVIEIFKYYSQDLAVALKEKAESEFQLLANGDEFYIPERKLQEATNMKVVLKKNENESYTVKAKVGIENLDEVRVKGSAKSISLDGARSSIMYGAGIDIIQGKSGVWIPEENKEGYFSSSIVESG